MHFPKMKRRTRVAGPLFLTYGAFFLLFYSVQFFYGWLIHNTNELNDPEPAYRTRQLLQLNFTSWNCTPAAIEQFPRPMMSQETRRQGAVAIHILVSLYIFLALAVVCDEYFVPSLERISEALKIKADVAGATFMAAGSSAPELATAILAVFLTKDDIGVGTVVGSAVYNIAFVVSVCGLFAGKVIHVNWWPLFRDCLFYLISIIALILSMQDREINWIESLMFLLLYVLYMAFMCVNSRLEAYFTKLPALSFLTPKCTKENLALMAYKNLPDSESDSIYTSSENTPQEEDDGGVLKVPNGGWRRCLWIVSLPILVTCYVTVPDCRRQSCRKWFALTFLMSCVWIGLYSYVLVWMITIIGYTFNIPDSVMGLTFLAAGVSVPDAISSLLVAKEGFGDMAISNAVGSNVFDILVCLGIPWFLQTAIIKPASSIPVYSEGLEYTSISLLATVLFLLIVTHLNGWKLDRKYGAIMMLWYILFMVVATLYQLNVFGQFTLPTCKSDY